jgi:hypothetical protein
MVDGTVRFGAEHDDAIAGVGQRPASAMARTGSPWATDRGSTRRRGGRLGCTHSILLQSRGSGARLSLCSGTVRAGPQQGAGEQDLLLELHLKSCEAQRDLVVARAREPLKRRNP